MVNTITAYEANDGSLWKHHHDARVREENIEKEKQTKRDKFLKHTHEGMSYDKVIRSNEYGIWEVKTFDKNFGLRNCSGTIKRYLIGYYQGTFYDVLDYVIDHKEFMKDNLGGTFSKINVENLNK